MASFIARRMLWMVLVLFAVSVVTFYLMRAIPGGPFDREKELPPTILASLEAKYNLDDPVWKQYIDYVGGIVIPRITDTSFRRTAVEDYLINVEIIGTDYVLRWGNFGPSLRQRSRTISDILRENLPVSVQLGVAALLVALLIGVPMGILSSLNRNTFWDYAGMSIATIGVSVTVITIGPIMQYLLGVRLGILPISGWAGRSGADWQWWQYMVMPAFALGFADAAIIARLTRASLLQILNEDFIRTARAKGLRERRVITVHALKNSMIPVVTVLGPMAADLITGSFITEIIFGIPGIGDKFVQSITDRDYPLIMGTVLLYSFVLVIGNALVDVSYAWIDPRIRYT